MPRHFEQHYPLMLGYTFPVVRTIIDKVGSPKNLKGIPPTYRHPLLASLALELSRVAVMIIYRGFSATQRQEVDTAILREFGGPRYYQLTAELDELVRRHGETNEALRRAAEEEYCLSDRGVEEEVEGAVIAPGYLGTPVRWRYDLFPAERIDRVRSELRNGQRTQRNIEQKIFSVQKALSEHVAGVRKTPEYQAQFGKVLFPAIDGDFSRGTDMQTGGAAYYLRNTDCSWWSSFTSMFRAQVATDVSLAPHKLALRDPRVLSGIDSHPRRIESTWDEAASEYLKQDASEWNVGGRTAAAIKGIRKTLRTDDARSIAWLAAHSRGCNEYTRWKANEVIRGAEAQALRCPDRAKKIMAAAHKTARAIHPRHEIEETRLNELAWCLSRGHDRAYPFQPCSFNHQDAADWESHRDKWWARIERAQRGKVIGS